MWAVQPAPFIHCLLCDYLYMYKLRRLVPRCPGFLPLQQARALPTVQFGLWPAPLDQLIRLRCARRVKPLSEKHACLNDREVTGSAVVISVVSGQRQHLLDAVCGANGDEHGAQHHVGAPVPVRAVHVDAAPLPLLL